MSILVFTKPNCPYCARAKAALEAHHLPYQTLDITANARNADASIYFSGVGTVPQIFIGERHINGSDDLTALSDAGRLEALYEAEDGGLPIDGPSDEDLAEGAEDLLLREVIPESDGTHDEDPEAWPILRLYKDFFGFWPNCFYFMRHWPEGYKLFVYCHNAGAIGAGREILGPPVMMATGFATSNAHGCNYCKVHMTAAGGDASLGIADLVEMARAGKAPPDAPIGPYEVALSDLAADATTHSVAPDAFARITALADTARGPRREPHESIKGTAMIASAFGFLNTFNDMTGVKVEPEWAAKAEQARGIEAGRHGVSSDRASTNLDHDLPQGGPTMEEMIAKYEAVVINAGGVEPYLIGELGLMPDWVSLWPGHLRARHAYLYCELMQPRGHSPIPSELKHLMARVSAIVRGHDYLAAVEAYLAARAGGDTPKAVERARHAFDAARGYAVPDDLFTPAETAALRLAWVSAQIPLTTPRRFVAPAVAHYGPVELVHLITVCALAGLVQRFCAIVRPEMEPEVERFMDAHGLETDTLAVRYPLAEETAALSAKAVN
ncbi:glutaredoxin domain-containing protein [Pelagibacterium xiamenense]|uniref:glutaredoxin domain-containing protein n=1 Tax=Pelagibacterium xiamenense TaxID=2901140 RepID=UPI001E2B426C|nr:glutaredoxin domain-containing protein [Pelagibacterium xiamenense]MCD7059744.1 glutathione S-transferase N-terminal domain-containing protein [Pelagibacterium xiamenense]